jgi:hypothetical protein
MIAALVVGYFVIWLGGIFLIYQASKSFCRNLPLPPDVSLDLIFAGIVIGSLMVYFSLDSFVPQIIAFLLTPA